MSNWHYITKGTRTPSKENNRMKHDITIEGTGGSKCGVTV
jgi:hypothetical protein